MSGPYGSAADAYWGVGWRGIIPLPNKKKVPPPDGYTGRGGIDPSYPDVMAWTEGKEALGNIALRLPVDMVGIDVDNYGDKTGGATLVELEAALGPLPATWRTTSRDDGVSGIRLYRAPGGLAWENPGDAIEIIHHGWRYAVVWPSLHPEGRTYRWINPAGVVTTTVPDPDTLPHLPAAWVERLNTGPASQLTRAALDTSAAAGWVATLPGASSTPCRRMADAASADATNLHRPGTTGHDTGCAAVARLVRLGAEGHAGVVRALEQVREAFIGNITRTGRAGVTRDAVSAQHEWLNILVSAVNLVSANAPTAPSCDCDGQLTALIVKDRPTSAPSAAHTDGSNALHPEAHENASTPVTGAPVADLDRTSWWPRDLGPVLSGEQTEEPPSILTRADGQPLWYRGKVNGLLGESESGKTWVALEAVRQVLVDGGRVLYLDFEDAATGIVSRLRSLGLSDAVIGHGLTYTDPAETLHPDANADLTETLNAHDYDLIVVDGFNAAMTLLGLDLISNTDATRFAQLLLKPLAKTGAAVAYIDHVTKADRDDSSGGIGAQAKRAMTTGCAIKVKVVEPFGKGMTGQLLLTVDKDRAGHVRGASGGGKNVGMVTLASDAELGTVTITIGDQSSAPTAAQRNRGKAWARYEAICAAIADAGNDPSTGAVLAVVGGSKTTLNEDLAALVRDGYVYDKGTKDAHLWALVGEPFTIAAALARTPVHPRTAAVHHTGGELPDVPRTPVPVSITGTGYGSATGVEPDWTVRVVAGKEERVNLRTGEVME